MTTIDVELLVPIVEGLARDVPADLRANLGFWGDFQQGRRDRLPQSVKELLAYMEREPALQIFNNGWQQFGGAGVNSQPQVLVSFLARRARATTPAGAVADLQRYLESDELQSVSRALIAGVSAGQPFEIGPGIQFIPLSMFADGGDETAQEISDIYTSTGVHPSALLEAPLMMPKRHSQTPVPVDALQTDPRPPDLDPYLLALRLVSRSGTFLISSWIRPPDWYPAVWRTRTMGHPPQFTIPYGLTDEDVHRVCALASGYRALDADMQSAVRLASSRLNDAMGHRTPVDKAVDLRIAYEVAFGIGDPEDREYQGELRFRLALRAAWLLGGSANERGAIFRDGRAFYDLASGAVHSAKIGKKWDGEKGQQVLDAAADILRRALTTMILNGKKPAWSDLVLG